MGFKSYREEVLMEPFDKGHNVIVGRNGSGKSNFFIAIQFVLSDEFAYLRPEHRDALLHKGHGVQAVTSYVEIILDNSDGRAPIEVQEIRLRRVIGIKKDQYFLNGKSVPRTEIKNLLEAIGFSRSNPYYIVKQGKINEMATAPNSYRLKLLRQVAGTEVFDEKRKETMTNLKETEDRVVKITESLRALDDRISKLEEENEELKQYTYYDKIKRVLEFVIYELQLNENRRKLAEVKAQRTESGKSQKLWADNLKRVQDTKRGLTKKTKKLKGQITALKEERDNLTIDQQHLIKKKTKVDLKIKDLLEDAQGDSKSKEKSKNELARLTQLISEKEAELKKLTPAYEAMKIREDECTRELALKEQKHKYLHAKHGRGTQFACKDDRDKWIQEELKSLNMQLKKKEDYHKILEAELKADDQINVELPAKIYEHTQELEKQRKYMDEYSKKCFELRMKNAHLQEQRNELWHKENTLTQNLVALKKELFDEDQQLRYVAGKSVLNGRDSVRKVLDMFISRGSRDAEIAELYYGLVIDNFTCDEAMYTAVEATVGNKLFYHIVESDVVGTHILKEMNNQKLPGTVNFIPLNRIYTRDINYPVDHDAVSILLKINYNQRHDKAMRFLFGRTMVCRDLDVGIKLARQAGFDCVTLEGEQASSKGTLTGGYFNKSRSRLLINNKRSKLIDNIKNCEEQLNAVSAKLAQTEDSINSVVSEMQRTETKISKAKAIYDKVNGELKLIRDTLSNVKRLRDPKERELAQLKFSLETMQTTKEELEFELHQELLSQLSAAERAEVDLLNVDIVRLRKEHKKIFSTRMELEAEKNKLENLLTNNLVRRKEEVLHALQEKSDIGSLLGNLKAESDEFAKKIEKLNTDISSVESKLNGEIEKLKSKQNELDNLVKKEKEAEDKGKEEGARLDNLVSKQISLEQAMMEGSEKINQLGTLPSQDLYEKFIKITLNNLIKELQKTNQKLKRYSHVNKKSKDQFDKLCDRKEKLKKRKDDLEKGHTRIKELFKELEQRKMDAIRFTFKQFSMFFTEMFKKLVPAGRANLVIETKDKDDRLDFTPDDTNDDDFAGIGIKVSFTEAGEVKDIHELSGGQKSLVALALIFAIQKCDPAPFYLFDEIDQALDPQNRKMVARMIHELSSEAQFITTTFRPELLEHANKCYGVTFRNKTSHVKCVSKEVAKNFVEDDPPHTVRV